MTVLEALLGALVTALVDAAGGHEKAHQLISEEAVRRANAAADAVALARIAAEKL